MLCEKDSSAVKNLLFPKRLYVFDMDGTIYLGKNVFPFAVEFINKLRQSGRRVMFFTNNASHDPVFYMDKLTHMGFSPSPDEICTSGNVASAFLTRKRPGKRVYLIGTAELYRQLKKDGVNLICGEDGRLTSGEKADIVLSSFDTSLTYGKLFIGCDFIRDGAEYLCTHPDYNCPTETGFIPDSGAIAALITASTGAEPTYFGKPHRETVEMIAEITGESKDGMVVFGDRLYTDIAVGKRHGITSCLVLTGETKVADVEKADVDEQPDVMLPSLGTAMEIMFG